MPAFWGREMGRQAGDSMPSTVQAWQGPQTGHHCIVQADNRDDHLIKGGGGQTLGFGGCQESPPPPTNNMMN